jgi:hypothetical protein
MAETPPRALDIPAKIFTNFLEELGKAEVPKEVVEKLSAALLTERDFSDDTLKSAILGEED